MPDHVTCSITVRVLLESQIELDISYIVATIREKRNLLIKLHPLRLQDLKQPASGFLILGLDKGKSFARRREFLLIPPEGQNTLTRNDFERILFHLLGFDITAVDAHRLRTFGDWT